MIESSFRLPQIQHELESSILATRETLEKLPKAPSADPSNEIANLLHGFVRDLARNVEGVPDEDGLLQLIRPSQESFRRAVRATAPQFQPFERRYAGRKKIEAAKFLISEDGGETFEELSETEEDDLYIRPVERIYIDEVLHRAHQ